MRNTHHALTYNHVARHMKAMFLIKTVRELNSFELKETHRSDISILFILLAGTRDREEENNIPRDADLSPHLEVNTSNAGVKRCTHEDIVNEVARHPNLLPSCDCNEVHAEADRESIDMSNGHEVAVVVDDGGEPESMGEMKGSCGDH